MLSISIFIISYVTKYTSFHICMYIYHIERTNKGVLEDIWAKRVEATTTKKLAVNLTFSSWETTYKDFTIHTESKFPEDQKIMLLLVSNFLQLPQFFISLHAFVCMDNCTLSHEYDVVSCGPISSHCTVHKIYLSQRRGKVNNTETDRLCWISCIVALTQQQALVALQ